MGQVHKLVTLLKNSKLVKSASVYTISTFLNSATPFILLPILTRYLSTEEYGVISMFNATTSFLVPFVGMSVSVAIIRKLADGKAEEGKEYIFNCLIIVACSSAVVTLIIILFSKEISKITEIPVRYLLFLIVYTISMCVCGAIQGLFQIQEKVKSYAFFQNVSTLCNLFLSIILVVLLRMSLRGRIYGLTFSKLLFAVIGLFLIFRYIGKERKINSEFIKDEITNFGFPMIPTEIKTTILTYTDKLFVTNMISIGATGVYAVGNQFSMPLLILEQAFNLAYVPWLFKTLSRDDQIEKKKIIKLTYCYFVGIIFIALAWSFCSQYLLEFVVGKEYTDAAEYIFWLTLGYAFTGMHMMVVNYIYYVKKIKLYSIVTVLVIITNIFLNYFFIGIMGTVGAAVATCIANAVSFILTWILSVHVYSMPWSLKH